MPEPYWQRDGISVYRGDCLQVMPALAGPVDAIIADLPYGTTQCAWDSVIPFAPLWECYKRLIKPNGAIVLFGSQPFTSLLVTSNLEWFKYDWVWAKDTPRCYLTANYQPLRTHEEIVVFSAANACWAGRDNLMRYRPQDLVLCQRANRRGGGGATYAFAQTSNAQQFTNYPRSLLEVGGDAGRQHPTQKPVALLEYLVRTYTDEGELVLDNTAGSCTTAVACVNTGRRCICIEREEQYCEVGRQRIEKALTQPALPLDLPAPRAKPAPQPALLEVP